MPICFILSVVRTDQEYFIIQNPAKVLNLLNEIIPFIKSGRRIIILLVYIISEHIIY